MKKTFTILALSVLVFGCAKKTTPTASTGAPASNNGSVSSTPATKTETVTNTGTVAVTPATPEGTRSPADAAKSPEMLGQTTYNAKCGRCHGLKVTTDYTAVRWVSIMQAMAPKAHLDDAEKENVLAYVKANSKK